MKRIDIVSMTLSSYVDCVYNEWWSQGFFGRLYTDAWQQHRQRYVFLAVVFIWGEPIHKLRNSVGCFGSSMHFFWWCYGVNLGISGAKACNTKLPTCMGFGLTFVIGRGNFLESAKPYYFSCILSQMRHSSCFVCFI